MIPETFEGDRVLLCDGEWGIKRNLACMNILKEWDIRELEGQRNFRTEILSDILHIGLKNLQTLNISQNNICSIEGISLIYMPSLGTLYLGFNCIRKIKEMRKGNWESLSTVFLENNLIEDYQKLCEAGIAQLSMVEVDSVGLCPDKRSLLKLQTSGLLLLGFHSHRPKYNLSIKNMLKRKWKHLVVYN